MSLTVLKLLLLLLLAEGVEKGAKECEKEGSEEEEEGGGGWERWLGWEEVGWGWEGKM